MTSPPGTICDYCGRVDAVIHRRHKDERYCTQCYYWYFPPTKCENCHETKRIHRNDKRKICKTCFTKITPCCRCGRVGLPISKVTASGIFCRACYNSLKEPGYCFLCKTKKVVSKGLSFGIDKPICDVCRSRLRPKCPQCGTRRKLYKTDTGNHLCYRCKNGLKFYCQVCNALLFGKDKTICKECSLKRLNEHRKHFNMADFKTDEGQILYGDFVCWLEKTSGVLKSAVKQNHYFVFFKAIELLPEHWYSDVNYLSQIDGGYLRKSSKPRKFLELKGIVFDEAILIEAMDLRTVQSNKLSIEQLKSSLMRSYALNYLQMREKEVATGELKIRTVRYETTAILALLEQYKLYRNPQRSLDSLLKQTPGHRAPIFKFVNYLRNKESVEICMPVKNSEDTLVMAIKRYLATSSDKNLRLYLFAALEHFHQASFPRNSNIQTIENGDGIEVTFKNFNYWIPSPRRLQKLNENLL